MGGDAGKLTDWLVQKMKSFLHKNTERTRRLVSLWENKRQEAQDRYLVALFKYLKVTIH